MKKSNHSSNNELWLVSYADLMTLLFGFFFLLYVSRDEDLSQVAQSLVTEIAPPKQAQPAATVVQDEVPAPASNSSETEKIKQTRLFLMPCRLCMAWDPRINRGQFTVIDVVPGGPADKAGIRDLDIIEAVNDDTNVSKTIDKLMKELQPNSKINFRISREGRRLDIVVLLDNMNSEDIAKLEPENPTISILPDLRGRKLNQRDRINYYIPQYVEGWLVTDVTASGNKIQVGDVIAKIKPNPANANTKLVKIYYDGQYRWVPHN